MKRIHYESESNKFLLFTNKNDQNRHECKPLYNFTPGKVQSLVREPDYSILPTSVSCLKGRQREIYDIMLELYQNKLVVVHSEKGMGKSSVIRNACQHIKHRMHYEDGIIFIN